MRTAVVVAALISGAGCGPSRGERAVAETKRVTEAMCACQTVACAEEAHSRWSALEERFGDTELTRAQNDALLDTGTRYLDCKDHWTTLR